MKRCCRHWRCVGAAAVLLLSSAALAAQSTSVSGEKTQSRMTRQELEQVLETLRLSASSEAYSSELRAEAERRAGRVEARLRQGDFRVGDFIHLTVRGQPALSDTFAVRVGPVLELPVVGTVDLQGVLHAELQSVMEDAVAGVIRNPEVQARSLVRLGVIGGVGRPGFYVVPGQTLLSDLLMLAGGPTRGARLGALRIERGREVVWEGERVEVALRTGETLEELGVRAGDRLTVPERTETRALLDQVRLVALVLPTLLFGISRLF